MCRQDLVWVRSHASVDVPLNKAHNILLQWVKLGLHRLFLGSLKKIYFQTKVNTISVPSQI